MPYRKREVELPEWLWFFLILPIGLIVLALWRNRQLTFLRRKPRYTEPDSIPLRMDFDAPPFEDDASLGADAEDAAAAGATYAGTGWQAETPSAETEQPVQPDDLTRVEGIGPAIKQLLSESGITTYNQLAGTPVERLDQILEEARLRRLANPATWPKQARLAAENKWDELAVLQGTLKAGRRNNG